MAEVYDIIVNGQTIHKGLSEETFFDTMIDLSLNYYEKGYPDPSEISHITYLKESP